MTLITDVHFLFLTIKIQNGDQYGRHITYYCCSEYLMIIEKQTDLQIAKLEFNRIFHIQTTKMMLYTLKGIKNGVQDGRHIT